MPVTTCNVSSIFECSHNIISLFAIANHFCSPNQDSSLISTAVLTQTTVQQVVGCGFPCSRSGRGELPGIDPLAASSRPLFTGSTLRMDHPYTGGDQRGVSKDQYRFAAEMAGRYLERREHLSLDRILCDPELAAVFDVTVAS